MLLLVVIQLLIDITSSYGFAGELEECIKSQRIIGGICTSITDRPFQALLFINKYPKCGASIISDRWILTAAHCVRSVPERYLTVGVGSSKVGGSTAQNYTIDTKIVHENFSVSDATVSNDIALLKTSKSIEYNIGVKPIILSRDPPRTGDKTIVSGYGVTTIDKFIETSEYLMSVEGSVIGMNQCESAVETVSPNVRISKGTFCAGSLFGGKDSCQGDSGGPITIGNILVGIVSWGLKCAERMMPAFYTDISYYYDWILKNTDENFHSEKRERPDKIEHGRNKLIYTIVTKFYCYTKISTFPHGHETLQYTKIYKKL